MNIKRGTVQTENFSMPWFSFGQGEKPVVILPGLSVTSVVDAAAAVAQEYACLAEDFTVYVFDRRVELPEVYPIAAMAEDTAAAMRQLGLHDVYLFGASQGGMMALVIAIEHPELVKKLALGSTTAHMHPEQAAAANRWLELARAGDGEGLCLAFGEAVYPPAVFAQYRLGGSCVRMIWRGFRSSPRIFPTSTSPTGSMSSAARFSPSAYTRTPWSIPTRRWRLPRRWMSGRIFICSSTTATAMPPMTPPRITGSG